MNVIFAALALFLVSCAETETLRVRQFHLREAKVADGNDFIRSEMNKRLYGAVTEVEREARRGQYYSVDWHGLSGRGPVRVLFEYRQVATGATVKRIEKTVTASREGKLEIQIIGEAYQKGGRVLAWRMSLYDDGDVVAQKKSYLWD